ncbi:DEAD/DEAH box helicase [Umboniibacter marinipuniceus]|uniref:Superfamily II DNA/RNA helicase n=1 Tax=Umboniibacter marinipuniceus TaxID=569599 RepID=A0A3M0A907_9GAMM|nr:DEAD/DEAH box helicase [Umboniibacter marinipuniceus]RMA79989.1 superfamily II DNA/RNA helicase [Umboniibacter marinipuniceus]
MTDSHREISFSDLCHAQLTLQGHEQATSIQSRAFANDGDKVFLLAPTGEGKTLAAVIRYFHQLEAGRAFQCLVLLPTRELAQQWFDVIQTVIGDSPLSAYALIGGEDYKAQAIALERGADILVATVGRLETHLESQPRLLDQVDFLIIDEADQQLGPDKIQEMVGLYQKLPAIPKHVSLLSATMHRNTLKLCEQHLGFRPTVIKSDHVDRAALQLLITPADDRAHKLRLLVAWLQRNQDGKQVVFCSRQEQAQTLEGKLKYHGINAAALHGALTPKGRRVVIENFRNSESAVLVTTDLSARGLDIEKVNAVVNVDSPKQFDNFCHRIGRGGRDGGANTVVNFVIAAEWNRVVGFARRLELPIQSWLPQELAGLYRGPKKLKASGKAAGSKKKKSSAKASGKKSKKLKSKRK